MNQISVNPATRGEAEDKAEPRGSQFPGRTLGTSTYPYFNAPGSDQERPGRHWEYQELRRSQRWCIKMSFASSFAAKDCVNSSAPWGTKRGPRKAVSKRPFWGPQRSWWLRHRPKSNARGVLGRAVDAVGGFDEVLRLGEVDIGDEL